MKYFIFQLSRCLLALFLLSSGLLFGISILLAGVQDVLAGAGNLIALIDVLVFSIPLAGFLVGIDVALSFFRAYRESHHAR